MTYEKRLFIKICPVIFSVVCCHRCARTLIQRLYNLAGLEANKLPGPIFNLIHIFEPPSAQDLRHGLETSCNLMVQVLDCKKVDVSLPAPQVCT